MLFGYLSEPKATSEGDSACRDDILCREAPLDCFSFERPLLLASELHVAGAMAFANSHGFGGLSLVQWAITQSLHSATRRLLANGHSPPSSR